MFTKSLLSAEMTKISCIVVLMFALVRCDEAASNEEETLGSTVASFEIMATSDPIMANVDVHNYYLNPLDLKNFSAPQLHERKMEMQKEFVTYLSDQLTYDDEGDVTADQRICMPLILRTQKSSMPAQFNYRSFIFKTVKEITDGRFAQNMANKLVAGGFPRPAYYGVVNYNSDTHKFLDLGPNFSLGDSSFTVTATIRLREKGGPPNRGARVLSMRDSRGQGWELVAPSYYGRQISFYTSNEPGHLDYGMAYIPKEEWTVVGIVFDREAYSNDVARITTYIDGVKDGDSTLITMRGSTVGRANLTIGNLRNERGRIGKGRVDYFEAKKDWKKYTGQFFGDIKDFFIWHHALNSNQMQRHAAGKVRRLNGKKLACKNGFKDFNCKCYKVFDQMASFNDASKICKMEGGTLAMPKTDEIQTFLESLMLRSNMKYFWIGLSDQEQESSLQWADGTYMHFRVNYNRFKKGKPDKTYKTEDCFEEEKARKEFIWNDEHCLKMNPFICEKTTLLPCVTDSPPGY